MAEREVRRVYTISREPHQLRTHERTSLAYDFLRREGYPASEATEAKAKHLSLVLFRVEDQLRTLQKGTRLPERVPTYLSDDVIVLLSQKLRIEQEDGIVDRIVTDMFIEPDPEWATRAINAFMFTPEDTTLQTS